ncbi:hypothetical protein ABK040_014366 [Willaertia magna]
MQENVETFSLQFVPYDKNISLMFGRCYIPLSTLRKLRNFNKTNEKKENNLDNNENEILLEKDRKKRSSSATSNKSNSSNSSTTSRVKLIAKGSSSAETNYFISGPCIINLKEFTDFKLLMSTWPIDDYDETNNLPIKSQCNVFMLNNNTEITFNLIQTITQTCFQNFNNNFNVMDIKFYNMTQFELAYQITLKCLTPTMKDKLKNFSIQLNGIYLMENNILILNKEFIFSVLSITSKKKSKSGIYKVTSNTIFNFEELKEEIINNKKEEEEIKEEKKIINLFHSKSYKELMSLLSVASSFFKYMNVEDSWQTMTQSYGIKISTPYSILIHGPHHIGKTLTIRSIARELKYSLIYVNCGTIHTDQTLQTIKNKIIEIALKKELKQFTMILFLDDLDKVKQNYFYSLFNIHDEVNKLKIDKIEYNIDIHWIIIGSSFSDSEFMKTMEMRGKFQREIKFEMPDQEERFNFCKDLYSKDFPNVDYEIIGKCTTGYLFYDLSKLFQSLKSVSNDGIIDTNKVLNQMKVLNIRPSIKSTVDSNNLEDENNLNEEERCEMYWSKIGGLHKVKQKLRQAAEWPMKYPESFKRLGLSPPRGILLYGPPGTGKTKLIRTLALCTHSTFIYCNVAQIYSPYVGESERAIRDIMSKARLMNPSIVFFDEIDSIVGKRDFSDSTGGDTVSSRVLSTLLNEMDGIESTKNLLVVAATNRPDMIDSALIRPGRLEHLLYVPPPDDESKRKIIDINLQNFGDSFLDILNRECSRKDYVDMLADDKSLTGYMTGAEIEALCREACMASIREIELTKQDVKLSWKHFIEARKRVKPYLSTKEGKKMLKRYEEFELSFEKK